MSYLYIKYSTAHFAEDTVQQLPLSMLLKSPSSPFGTKISILLWPVTTEGQTQTDSMIDPAARVGPWADGKCLKRFERPLSANNTGYANISPRLAGLHVPAFSMSGA